MKKILTVTLCSMAVGSMCAQVANVEAAKKLAGKIDKVELARQLVEEAKQNPETSNDPNTYFIAGKVEFDAFDKAASKQKLNPQDKDVNPLNMAIQALKGYENMSKVLEFDSSDPKVQKLAKDAIKKINAHYQDYNNSGATFWNEKKYFPEAYQAFYIYGELPSKEFADKNIKATQDTIASQAFFNAGLCAYSGNAVKEAAEAFKRARQIGTNNETCYIYEIASWQNLASKDSSLEESAQEEINNIATDGYNKFGIKNLIFFSNLVNNYLMHKQYDDAVALTKAQLEKTPDNANVIGLYALVLDRKGDNDESVENYRKAAEMPNVDRETLHNASKKLFKEGANKYNALDPKDIDREAKKQAIKADYYETAKRYAKKAQELNPASAHEMDYVLENIDYALETYFK